MHGLILKIYVTLILLHFAIKYGFTDAAYKSIDRGANLDIINAYGCTPLIYCRDGARSFNRQINCCMI
ncbi:hypothetical protein EON73_05425 [bacterium]|nr:MAG: hypothetical protein EON73_05425 [bacterium]